MCAIGICLILAYACMGDGDDHIPEDSVRESVHSTENIAGLTLIGMLASLETMLPNGRLDSDFRFAFTLKNGAEIHSDWYSVDSLEDVCDASRCANELKDSECDSVTVMSDRGVRTICLQKDSILLYNIETRNSNCL